MKEINFMDSSFYDEFIDKNRGSGKLNIRASYANNALPVSNLKVVVFKVIDNLKVIFYEGFTDNVGSISNISLPTPIIGDDNLNVPYYQDYDIEASISSTKLLFSIRMYSNISVVQSINIVPTMEEL